MVCSSKIGASWRNEAVTLPENVMDMDVEQPMFFSEDDATRFRCFEDLDKQYFIVNLDDDDFSRTENHHQDFSFLSYELIFVVA
uniref:Uncharacterized protein n=1 Tax=Oryza barthii TaxID=65489 RepID=A0A0D3EQ94_9ORYZ